jgi:hypothetical protein
MLRCVLGIVLCGLCTLAHAEENLPAQTIIDRANANNAFGFTNAVAHIRLVLQGPDRADKERRLDIFAQNRTEQQCTLVRFTTPADVAGTAFLTRNASGATSEQYLYLPALGKTKRITGTQRDQKFAGTDLTYADIQGQNVRDAQLKRLADAIVGGQNTYVVEALPRDAAVATYGKVVTYVHPEAYVPLKVEFFDAQQTLIKVLSVQRLEKRDGHWVATSMQVEDLKAQTKTRVTIEGIDFSAQPPARMCTPEALAG